MAFKDKKLSLQFDCCTVQKCEPGWSLKKTFCVCERDCDKDHCGKKDDCHDCKRDDERKKEGRGYTLKGRKYDDDDDDDDDKCGCDEVECEKKCENKPCKEHEEVDKHSVALYKCDDLRVRYKLAVKRLGELELCFFGGLLITNDSHEPVSVRDAVVELRLVCDCKSAETIATVCDFTHECPVLKPCQTKLYPVSGCIELTKELEEKLCDCKLVLWANVCGATAQCCPVLQFCEHKIRILDENSEKKPQWFDPQPEDGGRICYEHLYCAKELEGALDDCSEKKIFNVAKLYKRDKCGKDDCDNCEESRHHWNAKELGDGDGRRHNDDDDCNTCHKDDDDDDECEKVDPCDPCLQLVDTDKTELCVSTRAPFLKADCRTLYRQCWELTKCSSFECGDDDCLKKDDKHGGNNHAHNDNDNHGGHDNDSDNDNHGGHDNDSDDDNHGGHDDDKPNCKKKNPKRVRYNLVARKKSENIVVFFRFKVGWDDLPCPIPKYAKKFRLRIMVELKGECQAEKIVWICSDQFRNKPFCGQGCLSDFEKECNDIKVWFELAWWPETFDLCDGTTRDKNCPPCFIRFCEHCEIVKPCVKLYDTLSLDGDCKLKLLKFESSEDVSGELIKNCQPTKKGICVDLKDVCEVKICYEVAICKCSDNTILTNEAKLTNILKLPHRELHDQYLVAMNENAVGFF